MTTIYGAGGLIDGHIPLPVGPQPIRPVARRSTSPWAPPPRPGDLSPAQQRASERAAAKLLRGLDARRRGEVAQAYNQRRRAERKPSEPVTPDWLPRAIDLYTSGLSFANVAKQVGASEITVNKWVKRAGIQPRSGRPQPAVDPERIRDLAKTHTARQIADVTGLAVTTVHNRLSMLGVKAVASKRTGPEPLPLDMDEVKRLYAAGQTPRQIGDALGCSHQTIRARLREAGVDLRQEAGRKVDTEERCRRNHAWTPENTGRNKKGHRYCRACRRITKAAWDEKQKEAAA